MVKSKWSNISKAIWDTWQWNMPRSKVILGMKIWMEFVNVLSVCTAFHQLSQILFSSFRNLSGLCVAIWNQFTEENLLRVKIPLKWKLNDDNWWVCLIGGCLFWLPAGWGHQSGGLRMSFAPVEEWARVASKPRYRSQISLLRVTWIQGGSTPVYNKCFQLAGMLKRGKGGSPPADINPISQREISPGNFRRWLCPS